MTGAAAMLLAMGMAFGQVPASPPDSTSPNAGAAQPQPVDQSSQPLSDREHSEAEIEKQIELAHHYVLKHDDERAMSILRDVLRKAPSNRNAKIELALILGYRKEYKKSDQLYRELLSADPNDEAASLGLIRNLLREQRTKEASHELEQALARHPNSILLQEYQDRFGLQGRTNTERDERRRPSLVQAGESFFADSAGNRSLSSMQLVEYQINRYVGNRLRLNELSLWNGTAPRANVFVGTDGFEIRPTRFLTMLAEARKLMDSEFENGLLTVQLAVVLRQGGKP